MQSILDLPEIKPDYTFIQNIDIVQVIERCGVSLHKTGDIYSGLCPLHGDKNTESLKVYPVTNSWCCFGTCGNGNGYNGGNSIEFIRQRYGFSFHQTVDWLEQNFIFNPVPKVEHKEPKKKQIKIAPDNVLYWHSLLDSFNKRDFFHKRGFTDETINEQLLGFDSKRFTIPVWDGLPQQSEIIGIRRRKRPDDASSSPKYIGLEGSNQACVYGKYSCIGKDLIIAFAGELDCLRAIQDNLPAFSMVNGANAFKRFPDNWPNLWFPDSTKLAVCFDKKEEIIGAQLAGVWNKVKGDFSAKVMHYPLTFSGKDYCDWRDSGRSAQEFYNRVLALF